MKRMLFAMMVSLVAASCCGLAQDSQPAVEVTTSSANPSTSTEAVDPCSITFWVGNPVSFVSSPWLFCTGTKGLVVDVRPFVDAPGTLTTCIGKSLGGSKFNLSPEFCGYVGRYRGFGPEAWVSSLTRDGRISFSSYLQHAKFTGGTESFGYTWIQPEWKFSSLGLGVTSEFSKTKKEGFEANMGASITIPLKRGVSVNLAPMIGLNGGIKGKFIYEVQICKTFGFKKRAWH